jgi:hypothetical protein
MTFDGLGFGSYEDSKPPRQECEYPVSCFLIMNYGFFLNVDHFIP